MLKMANKNVPEIQNLKNIQMFLIPLGPWNTKIKGACVRILCMQIVSGFLFLKKSTHFKRESISELISYIYLRHIYASNTRYVNICAGW